MTDNKDSKIQKKSSIDNFYRANKAQGRKRSHDNQQKYQPAVVTTTTETTAVTRSIFILLPLALLFLDQKNTMYKHVGVLDEY